MSKKLIQNLLSHADVTVNGNNPWDIQIFNDQFYSRVLSNTELALGESYMEKWWDCANLDKFFYRIFSVDLHKTVLKHPKFWRAILKSACYAAFTKVFNPQTKNRAFTVGERHYDIGHDLYSLMLDKRLVYSCAYWENANTLDEAQEKKLELCCQKLALKPGMVVLDIGCGWGSFAKYAAEKYGVSVVGITVSKEQYQYAQTHCLELPVEFRFQDYRELLKGNEKFDRIISVGMFEHVGDKNYKVYMQTVAHCLKDDGLFLLHTIGANETKHIKNDAWFNIYIFPNSQIPSIQQIGKAIEGIFVMEDWHNFGVYYDKTLMAWHQNFNDHWDLLSKKYGERFRRMWNYYLLSFAANFRTRQLFQVWQLVLSKKGLANGYKRPL
jgi:cyclopropane-fatty-acyl-phospholipid synthase